MRTVSWETVPQIALRDCSKEAVREGQCIKILVKGSSMQSSAYFTKGFLLVTNEMMSSCKKNIDFSTVRNGFKGCCRNRTIKNGSER